MVIGVVEGISTLKSVIEKHTYLHLNLALRTCKGYIKSDVRDRGAQPTADNSTDLLKVI